MYTVRIAVIRMLRGSFHTHFSFFLLLLYSSIDVNDSELKHHFCLSLVFNFSLFIL